MTDYRTEDVLRWVGKSAFGTGGEEIGRVEAIYEDDDFSGPEWFAITTGGFGDHVSFAPVRGATIVGERVWLSWGKDAVEDAPHCEIDGHLSAEDEARLYAYYAMEWPSPPAQPSGDGQRRLTSPAREDATRPDEEVNVRTRSLETGRVRLRKWVETEGVNVTVPVRREVARVVMEPITGENMGPSMSDSGLGEREHDALLNEEDVEIWQEG